MNDRKKKIQDQLDTRTDLDTPVVIEYADGSTATMPTLRQMLQDALALEDQFDDFMARGGFASFPKP